MDAERSSKNLRRKLEPDPANPRYVLTVYGSGCQFSDEPLGADDGKG